MVEQPISPKLVISIPAQIVNEGATYGPLKLASFIKADEGAVRFRAELSDGRSLPTGLICTQDGIVNGIPANGTQGSYKIKITAEDDSGRVLTTEFDFTIKSKPAMDSPEMLGQLKAQIWEALGNNMPLPEMADMLNRPITATEIYYLLERFATLTVWDVYNLEYPGEKKVLSIEGVSPHYVIYDRGSCLVVAPKDLFSHERTLEDALQTARAVAGEVYKRGWVIELVGFNKMITAAWVELQHLGDQFGKQLEVLHFAPTSEDIKVYVAQAGARMASRGG